MRTGIGVSDCGDAVGRFIKSLFGKLMVDILISGEDGRVLGCVLPSFGGATTVEAAWSDMFNILGIGSLVTG